MADTKPASPSGSGAKAAAAKAPIDEVTDPDAGLIGEEVDPTPREEYSLESDSWNTPETDRDAHAEAFGEASAAAKFGPEE